MDAQKIFFQFKRDTTHGRSMVYNHDIYYFSTSEKEEHEESIIKYLCDTHLRPLLEDTILESYSATPHTSEKLEEINKDKIINGYFTETLKWMDHERINCNIFVTPTNNYMDTSLIYIRHYDYYLNIEHLDTDICESDYKLIFGISINSSMKMVILYSNKSLKKNVIQLEDDIKKLNKVIYNMNNRLNLLEKKVEK